MWIISQKKIHLKDSLSSLSVPSPGLPVPVTCPVIVQSLAPTEKQAAWRQEECPHLHLPRTQQSDQWVYPAVAPVNSHECKTGHWRLKSLKDMRNVPLSCEHHRVCWHKLRRLPQDHHLLTQSLTKTSPCFTPSRVQAVNDNPGAKEWLLCTRPWTKLRKKPFLWPLRLKQA